MQIIWTSICDVYGNVKRAIREAISNQCSDEEELELVSYGLFRLCQSVCGVAIAVIIGALLGITVPMICFLIFFIPLRVNAGGSHMKTVWQCAISSATFILLIGVIIRSVIVHEIWIDLFLIGISGLYIWFMAPVENSAKRLYPHERKNYKIKVRILLFFEILTCVAATYFSKSQIRFEIMLALVSEAIFMMVGKMQLREKCMMR
ncbi:MAG: accessory gene regulator B family protein [Acetatifactor sp.]|nr:accessory gene regulator B family protein [Acetatifactor sp.]